MLPETYLKEYTLDSLVSLYESTRDHIAYSSFDFETTGVNPYKGNQAFSMAICYPNMKKEIIDFRKSSKGSYFADKKNWKKVQNYFNDTSLAKVAHNLLFEKAFLKRHNIEIPDNTIFHDSMVIHQILRNDHPSHALDYIAWEYGKWPRDLDKTVSAIGKINGYHRVSKKLMHPYQLGDVERCLCLFNVFHADLLQYPIRYRDYLNELLIIDVTERMQETGLGLNKTEAYKLLKTVEGWLLETQERVEQLTGRYYNLNSTSPLHYLLFEKLKLPVLEYTKTGRPKVDKTVLFKYKEKYIDNNPNPEDRKKYELINLIFKTRSYIKGIANLKSYIKFAGESGILHPSIKSNHAKTGRAASENPNSQNIQKEKSANVPFPIPARNIFYAPDGFIYYLVDYAGIEMRLIVDAVKEAEMMYILNHGDGDLHAPVASLFFGSIFDNELDRKLKKTIRSKAKNVNFAIPYGVGEDKAYIMLMPYAKSMKHTRDLLEKYEKTYPKIFNYSNSVSDEVKRNGYVETAFGRVLRINRNDAYMGGNYKIQGTGAQVLKHAEVKIDRYSKEVWRDRIRMVITIHDELLIRVPKRLERFEHVYIRDMSEIMTHFDKKHIGVKLDVEWKKTYTSWADAQEFDWKQLKSNKGFSYAKIKPTTTCC